MSEQHKYIDDLNASAWEVKKKSLDQAYQLAQDALNLSEKNSYLKGKADAHRTLGSCFWLLSDYEKALLHSDLAQKIYTELKEWDGVADTISATGAVYVYLNENQKRLALNELCLELRKRTGNREGELAAINNLGDTYMSLQNWAKAEELFLRALTFKDVPESSFIIIYLNLGELYISWNKKEKAISFLDRTLRLVEKYEQPRFGNAACSMLASIYLEQSKPKEAYLLLEKGLEYANIMDAPEDKALIYKLLSEFHEKNGNAERALHFFKLFYDNKEKVYNQNNARELQKKHLQYQIENAERHTLFEKEKNVELKAAYDEISSQQIIISQKNKDITDSIRYARRIQEALLTPLSYISEHSGMDFWLYNEPKDVVSGDFYWAHKHLEKDDFYMCLGDCTGHGVPGAFLSLLMISFMHQAVLLEKKTAPNQIFESVRVSLWRSFAGMKHEHEGKDGMDVILCCFDSKLKTVRFAAANNSFWLIRTIQSDSDFLTYERNGNEVQVIPKYYQVESKKGFYEIKPDKLPVSNQNMVQYYSEFKLNVLTDDVLYLSTDGIGDQFGGPEGKKMKIRTIQKYLLDISVLDMEQQKEKVVDYFTEWKGKHEQVDDVLIAGFKIP